jgi:hypothetical protein
MNFMIMTKAGPKILTNPPPTILRIVTVATLQQLPELQGGVQGRLERLKARLRELTEE